MKDFDPNSMTAIIKMLEQLKTLNAIKDDKAGLINYLLSANPKSAQIMNAFEQTKKGDLSSILPYVLSINKNKQTNKNSKEKEQIKKASVQTKAQSFGLKPIANIATAQILKDIINLLD
ncbi:MAG: hypothetical protein IKC00_01545 [Clostridia bacterium]|nr:hypothetical protein [Clostridia bacterium]